MHLIMHLMISTGKGIGSDQLKTIEDVPCLIIWGANDSMSSVFSYIIQVRANCNI